MQYTEIELAKLIETVETEFTAHLSKAEAAHKTALAKSEEPPKKEEKPSEKKPEDKKAPEADAKPADAKPAEGAAPAAPAADAAPAAAAPADAAAPGAAPAAAAGHGYDDEDMAHMDKMYASMSREELMAHHDSVKRALDAQSAAAPAPAAAAPAPAAAAPVDKGMIKTEIKDENPVLNSKPTDKGNETNTEYNKNSGGKQSSTGEPNGSPGAKSPASKAEGVQMEKSEKEFDLIKGELEAEKAKSAELKKNFDAVQEFLTKFVGKITAPKAKAITEVAALAKNEGAADAPQFSKSEITQKLLAKSSDPKLEKSDRAAINEFYATGQVNVNSISHLLK